MTLYLYVLVFLISASSYYYNLYTKSKFYLTISFSLIIFLVIISSFRWEVGGDWDTYLSFFNKEIYIEDFFYSPVFFTINKLFLVSKLGQYGLNFFAGFLLFFSFYSLSRKLNHNFLFYIPALIATVYYNGLMGYVRQTFALSFLVFFIINILSGSSFNKKIIFLILSVFTHYSSILFSIMLFLNFEKKNLYILILFLIVTLGLIFFVNLSDIKVTFNEFVLKGYSSPGAIARFSICLIILCLVFLIKDSLIIKNKQTKFFIFFSINIIILYFFLLISFPNLSGLIDRLNFYNIIFIVYILGESEIFFKNKYKKLLPHIASLLFIIFFLINFLWFILGKYSVYWLNYKFIY